MEKAKAYKRLMDIGLTGKKMVKRFGITEKYVSEFIALLRLSEKIPNTLSKNIENFVF